ncbi:hypothetical protein RCC89_14105 [Cytophagaceae bacterium ABcell3]|nr:hypothetical protein RCC89_14105 [Cytophagaceae bacterium ABcell3]
MADIRIQKKKPIWPWVLGVLLGLLVIWLVVRVFDRERQVADIEDPEVQNEGTAGIPQEINEFLTYVAVTDTLSEEQIDHAHVSRGVRLLAGALEVLSKEYRISGIDIKENRARLDGVARYIQQSPNTGLRADSLRSGLISAVNWMEQLQIQRFPRLDTQIGQVRAAAKSIDIDVQIDEQGSEVQRFFNLSGGFIRDIVFQEEDVLVYRQHKFCHFENMYLWTKKTTIIYLG